MFLDYVPGDFVINPKNRNWGIGQIQSIINKKVTANFENIGGLKPRAPVKGAGVVVGRVNSIVFDTEAYHAIVSIDIDKRYVFPKDTFANIYTAGLLGEQYIGLEAGGEEKNLEQGDRITQTQDAVVLEKLISQFLYSKASEEE